MRYKPKPVEWFIARIGKTVYRDRASCTCAACLESEKNGIFILDEMQADYMATVDRDFASEGVFMNYRDVL